MPNRFATQEQIDFIADIASSIETYQGVIPQIVEYIAGLIEIWSPDSGLEVRYITSEGRDAEKWRGSLLAKSKVKTKVDVWCLSITFSQMLAEDQGQAVNSFDKPFGLGIDYYYDFDQGTDSNNSEDFFNKKVDGFEYILEQQRSCLPNGAIIESGIFRRMHHRFTNATTHVAKGDFAIKIEGL